MVAVVLQTVLADRAIWHAGWYSVALGALLALTVAFARRALHARAAPRIAVWAVACGTGVLGAAGIASGLLAPGPQLVIAAPGVWEPVAGLGEIHFPPLSSGDAPALQQGGRVLPIGAQRYVGSFVLRTIPRTVVDVHAYTPGGAQLTVTQPQGSAFSSPVLLMDQTQVISGMQLPFDSFAVPAAHRIVKAVLFSARQVALMRAIAGPPEPIVLFAVDDEMDDPIPHAIAMARNGSSIRIGGLRLRPTIANYPAVDVLSVPSLVAVVTGLAMLAAGAALAILPIRTPLRS
jgi:hypothetical protein